MARVRLGAARWAPNLPEWRTLSRCPVCTGYVHLVRDAYMASRPTSPRPHARIADHDNLWGEFCYMSHRAAPAWDEPTTRAAVWGRSMGVCEYCQAAQAAEMHHRQSRGVGGKWHPANIVHLCAQCHREATNPSAFGHPPEWGHTVGLVVKRYENPADWPLQQKTGGLLWLTDDVTGGLHDEHRTRSKRRNS